MQIVIEQNGPLASLETKWAWKILEFGRRLAMSGFEFRTIESAKVAALNFLAVVRSPLVPEIVMDPPTAAVAEPPLTMEEVSKKHAPEPIYQLLVAKIHVGGVRIFSDVVSDIYEFTLERASSLSRNRLRSLVDRHVESAVLVVGATLAEVSERMGTHDGGD